MDVSLILVAGLRARLQILDIVTLRGKRGISIESSTVSIRCYLVMGRIIHPTTEIVPIRYSYS